MNIWYHNLVKPPLTPPVSYFPLAWKILYILMAIAFLIVLAKPDSDDKLKAIGLFLFQLILNIMWSYVFFKLQSPLLGLIDVIFLFLILLMTIYYFFKVSKVAGFLLIPYLLQVIFAIYLNIGILILN